MSDKPDETLSFIRKDEDGKQVADPVLSLDDLATRDTISLRKTHKGASSPNIWEIDLGDSVTGQIKIHVESSETIDDPTTEELPFHQVQAVFKKVGGEPFLKGIEKFCGVYEMELSYKIAHSIQGKSSIPDRDLKMIFVYNPPAVEGGESTYLFKVSDYDTGLQLSFSKEVEEAKPIYTISADFRIAQEPFKGLFARVVKQSYIGSASPIMTKITARNLEKAALEDKLATQFNVGFHMVKTIPETFTNVLLSYHQICTEKTEQQ